MNAGLGSGLCCTLALSFVAQRRRSCRMRLVALYKPLYKKTGKRYFFAVGSTLIALLAGVSVAAVNAQHMRNYNYCREAMSRSCNAISST